MSQVDLHTHSKASDGSLLPKELVQSASQKNIAYLSLTDHDTVKGIKEAIEECEKENIKFIPGVEFGTDYNGTEIHILGYFNNVNYIYIDKFFEEVLTKRKKRNLKLIDNLNNSGFDISYEDILEKSTGTIGRVHIGLVLIEKGYVKNMSEAFSKILKRKDIHVKREKMTPKMAIDIILGAKGIPVVAHPVYFDNDGLFDDIMKELLRSNIKGVEAYHSDHNKENEAKYIAYAKEHNLLVTGGSDFHGTNKDNAILGSCNIPYDIGEKLYKILNTSN